MKNFHTKGFKDMEAIRRKRESALKKLKADIEKKKQPKEQKQCQLRLI